MTRQTNDSVPDLLLRHNWPVDREFILITGGFGELWIIAPLVAEIMKEPHRAFILSESAANIFGLFVDRAEIQKRAAILNDESQITKFEAFVSRYSPSYTQQYFAGKRFIGDIRCSSIVHYPYLCRAVQANMLSYHDALKVMFDLDIQAVPKLPDTTITDDRAQSLLSKVIDFPLKRPVCLLFVVNVTHEGLDLSAIHHLVELIESKLGMDVLINVTLGANANGHALGKAKELVEVLLKGELAPKCIEIEGCLLASVGKLISLSIGANGGGMDVIRLFGSADVIYVDTLHRWQAGTESNQFRNVSDTAEVQADDQTGRIIRHKDFLSGPRGVFCYTPKDTKVELADLNALVTQYQSFTKEHSRDNHCKTPEVC